MRKEYTNDEIDFMSIALEQGWTHKEIANELNRTAGAIKAKASKLELRSLNNKKKTTEEYKDLLPIDIIVLESYINDGTKILHKHSCGFEWLALPNNILAGHGCTKCGGTKKKTHEEYQSQVPNDIELLEEYINDRTKILHKHICGFEWTITPSDINSGRGCPACAISGFQPQEPAVTYLVYFPEHDLYKIGISNNYLRRFKQFGSKPEIIFIREFELGIDAKELESKWLENVDHLKINTGLLKSGNTETFKYKA